MNKQILQENLNLIREYLETTNAPFRYKEAFIVVCLEARNE